MDHSDAILKLVTEYSGGLNERETNDMSNEKEDKKGRVDGTDAFARVDYRRLIAWSKRIEREKTFLLEEMAAAPCRRLCDLGCGTGEHSRFFHESGFDVVGLDNSPTMLEKAREFEAGKSLRFVEGNLMDVKARVGTGFGGAISLGNTLVHLTSHEELEKAIKGVASVLERGGIFLFQVLNYERLITQKIRFLPLNFVEGGEGETIFLRLMEFLPGKVVRFCPSTLVYRPGQEEPLSVSQSRIVELRGWDRQDFHPLLEAAGFEEVKYFGNMERAPFHPEKSSDLVVVAKQG